MPFPFNLTGRIPLERPASPDSLLRMLQAEIQGLRPRSLQRDGNTINFTGGVSRLVSNWNLLVPIDRGSISLESDQYGAHLFYRVSYVHLFLMASLTVFGFMAPFLIFTASDLSLFAKLLILAFMWLWLFGGNVVLSALRFPAFLRRLVDSGRLTSA